MKIEDYRKATDILAKIESAKEKIKQFQCVIDDISTPGLRGVNYEITVPIPNKYKNTALVVPTEMLLEFLCLVKRDYEVKKDESKKEFERLGEHEVY